MTPKMQEIVGDAFWFLVLTFLLSVSVASWSSSLRAGVMTCLTLFLIEHWFTRLTQVLESRQQ
jgi:hypothetical protein